MSISTGIISFQVLINSVYAGQSWASLWFSKTKTRTENAVSKSVVGFRIHSHKTRFTAYQRHCSYRLRRETLTAKLSDFSYFKIRVPGFSPFLLYSGSSLKSEKNAFSFQNSPRIENTRYPNNSSNTRFRNGVYAVMPFELNSSNLIH